ncbi:MAG: hypothetical protein V7640_2979, partial [Betaproteobacteria bacterium]
SPGSLHDGICAPSTADESELSCVTGAQRHERGLSTARHLSKNALDVVMLLR